MYKTDFLLYNFEQSVYFFININMALQAHYISDRIEQNIETNNYRRSVSCSNLGRKIIDEVSYIILYTRRMIRIQTGRARSN
jgi:hypothetical protein